MLVVIPARYESTRFPGKPLVDIKGKSMIMHVYDQVKKAEKVDEVVIATDDVRIFDHCNEHGAHVMMTSTKHQNGTERIAEVVRRLEGDYENIINVQGDEPFIQPEQIDLLANVLQNPKVQIATLAKMIDNENELHSPNTVKVVLNQQSMALYFSRFPIPFTRNNSAETVHFKHIGLYGYKLKTLNEIHQLSTSMLEKAESLEQLRWLEAGYPIHVAITTIESMGIDTPDDLKEALLKI
jgi:3-deoxy-manno-octulosonate cytidylyltransferase (CMP-KDO synthetase)